MKPDIKKRLAYLRNRFRLAGLRLADGKFEVFNTAPASLHVWKQVDTLDEAVDLANQLVEKHNDSTFNVWSPDQQQAYQVHNRGGELEVTVKPTKAVEPQPKRGPVDKRPWDEQMAEYWMGEKRERAGSSQKILVGGGVYRSAAWSDDGTVDDVGFDGFIGVFDPDKDKKRDEADSLWVLDKMREQGRTNLPVVVDEDVLPVNGKTKKRKS
jgi:hypothetical protein